MMRDVISTSRAADILGCSRASIINMINNGTIKSAYMGCADGNVGRPDWRISVTEVHEILEQREHNSTVEKHENVEATSNRDEIKNALNELHTCLIMLAETIEKLQKGL